MSEWFLGNARRIAIWCAGVMTALALLLLADAGWAAVTGPKDDKLIKSLQERVKADATLAPKLAAEQKRVTAWRQSRRKRDKAAGWVLLGVSLLFLTAAKQVVKAERRVASRSSELLTIAAERPRFRRPRHAHADAGLDLNFVDQLVAERGRGAEAAIAMLQAIQEHYRYLPDEAMSRLCELTEITPAQVAGTSTFYHQFRRTPVGKHILRVCHGTACHVSGARQVSDELRRHLEIPEGQDTDPSRTFTLDEVACLGCCSLAPVMMVDGETAGRLTPASACDAAARYEERETR